MTRIDAMARDSAPEPLIVQRRRESRREEWYEHITLAGLLAKYLDPSCTFWTSLENKPISRISGIFQKKRGVRRGLPDVQVIWRGKPIFIELKSRIGIASKAQKQIRLEMQSAGARWWMVRSARAALRALQLEGVVFRCKWKSPRLEPWEGPFTDPDLRLPQHPEVAARRREAQRVWRERQRARKAVKLAAERDGGAAGDIAA